MNINKQYLLVIFSLSLALFLSCKKETNIEKPEPNDPTDTITYYGEQMLEIPGHGFNIKLNSKNEYLIPGTSLLDLDGDNWMESYPLLAVLGEDCKLKKYKFPIDSIVTTSMDVIEVDNYY